jgi:hypothetical protein
MQMDGWTDSTTLIVALCSSVNVLKKEKANWISHILCRKCLLKHVTEGRMEVMGR